MYVADCRLGSVVASTATAASALFWEELRQPAGLALATNSSGWPTPDVHALFQYSLDGRLLATSAAGGEGPGEFNFPTHLCCGPEGRLYVTDLRTADLTRMRREAAWGSVGRKGGGMGQFNRPKGVAVDRHAHIRRRRLRQRADI
ncbi:MAG: hypothetical protein U1F77_10695 [Kiritimatiellia bacterium]